MSLKTSIGWTSILNSKNTKKADICKDCKHFQARLGYMGFCLYLKMRISRNNVACRFFKEAGK